MDITDEELEELMRESISEDEDRLFLRSRN